MENTLSHKLGKVKWQICNHNYLPISASLDIYEEISWEDLWLFWESRVQEIYKNIWYIRTEISTYKEIWKLFSSNYEFMFDF